VAAAAVIGGACTALDRAGAGSDTLVVAMPHDVPDLDAAELSNSESYEIGEQIYDTLVRINEEKQTVEPRLAARWDVSPDGRVTTFHLRPDVVFHDGTPLDAEAVVFSLRRMSGKTRLDTGKLKAVGRHQVRLETDQPAVAVFDEFGIGQMAIVSPAAVKRYGTAFGQHPVGTGPFRFVSRQAGDQLRLERFERYWGPRPPLAALTFRVLPDSEVRLAQLRGGLVDLVYGVSAADLRYAQLHPHLVLHRSRGMNVLFLAMNTGRPPFDRLPVRQAVAHAIDKPVMTRLLMERFAEPARSLVPASSWGHHGGLAERPHDRALARQLLAQAARQAGQKLPLVTDLVTIAGGRGEPPSRAIVAQLAEIGLEVHLRLTPAPGFRKAVSTGQQGMVITGWSNLGDPDNFLPSLVGPQGRTPGQVFNVAFYRNPMVDALLDQARRLREREARRLLYLQAQTLLHQDLPVLPLWTWDEVMVARTEVAGLKVHPTLPMSLAGVRKGR
jgi:peptide/nickel transport system substrate-binding protein